VHLPAVQLHRSVAVPAFYTKSLANLDLTGTTALSFWLGLGTDYWDTWHSGASCRD